MGAGALQGVAGAGFGRMEVSDTSDVLVARTLLLITIWYLDFDTL